jgi:hypothetical protein
MWVLHDGAPAHFFRYVMQYLDSHYPGQGIGKNRPVVWHPSSPDLTPANFCLSGHLSSTVYTQRCNTQDEQWNANKVGKTKTCNMPDAF